MAKVAVSVTTHTMRNSAALSRRKFLRFCTWTLLATLTSTNQIPLRESSHDKLGAVACENKSCTEVGIDLLKLGGSAADAVGILLIIFCPC